MLSRLRNRFGTAGLVVAVIALVAALGGGAYAASGGLTGKQKKEVEKIAKKNAGKPGPAGAQGPAGPAGAAGAKGENGAPGSPGSAGTPGAAGTGVTTKHLLPGEGPDGEECEEGGTELTSSSGVEVICNGIVGAQGPAGATGAAGATGPVGPSCNTNGPCVLPVGSTLTGNWAVRTPGGEQAWVSVSFALRLAVAPDQHFVTLAQQEKGGVPGCPVPLEPIFEEPIKWGYEDPQAEPGHLCVYQGFSAGVNLDTPFLGVPAERRSGFGVSIPLKNKTLEAYADGTWAVTAGP